MSVNIKTIFKHLDDNIEIYLSAFTLLVFSVLCILQVVMRYTFNNSLSWSEELSRYAFVWFVYTSASYAVRYQRHVKFTFFINFVHTISPVANAIVKLIALLCWLSFLIIVDFYSANLVIAQYHTGQVSPATRIPMYLVYAGLPLGASLMTFRVTQHIVRGARDLRLIPHNKLTG